MKFKKLVIYIIFALVLIALTISPLHSTTTASTNQTPPEAVGNALTYLPYVTNPPRPTLFVETFDGNPAHPTPWQPPYWDITVHSRDKDTWLMLESMDAQHGPNCEGPPATHFVSSTYEEAVYQCKDHVMTAINATGYGMIYLTPNYMVDFSQGEAVIRWDMSTEHRSLRDWIDLWVTPYDDNLQLTLQDWLPDLNGPPKNALHIYMGDFNGKTTFDGAIFRNFNEEGLDNTWWSGYEDFLEPSPMRRDTFELRISRTHITFGMPDYDFWWIDTDISSLNWSQAVLQFGHHSYNPWKDGNGGPQTWHWDNVHIEPASPFTIIQGDRRYVNALNNNKVNFPEPAPANSHLRFAGIGNDLQVSFNNGNTWQDAVYQSHEDNSFPDESFKSYWMPIPAGTSSVRFRGENWWGGGWHFRDISIWSIQAPDVAPQPKNWIEDAAFLVKTCSIEQPFELQASKPDSDELPER